MEIWLFDFIISVESDIFWPPKYRSDIRSARLWAARVAGLGECPCLDRWYGEPSWWYGDQWDRNGEWNWVMIYWNIHGYFMGYSWIFHGIFMDISWDIHGISWDIMWNLSFFHRWWSSKNSGGDQQQWGWSWRYWDSLPWHWDLDSSFGCWRSYPSAIERI